MSDATVLHLPSGISPPKHWQWRRLDDVCDGTFDCPHSTPVISPVGPFMVRSQDIRSGVFMRGAAARVSEGTYKQRTARAEPREGDLLYSREGTYFGIAALVPAGTRLCLGQRMVLIRPSPSVVRSRFLWYWLNSPFISAHAHGFRDGSVAERLNLPSIRGLPVLLPPIEEQHAIESLIAPLDDKIDLNRRMNAALVALNQAEFAGELVGSEVELHDLGEVADVVDCLHSKKPEPLPSGDRLLLQLEDILEDGSIDLRAWYRISEYDFAHWTSRITPEPGDCVITNVGRVGAVGQIPDWMTMGVALGRNMTAIRPRSIPPTFLLEALVSPALRAEIRLNTDSGTILDSLNVRRIGRLRVPSLPQAAMESLEQRLRPRRALVESNLAESRSLSELRDALLPRLLSGELMYQASGELIETK